MASIAQQFLKLDRERLDAAAVAAAAESVAPGPRDTQPLLPDDAIEAKRALAIGLLERMPRLGVEISFRLLLELREYWMVREAHAIELAARERTLIGTASSPSSGEGRG